MVLAVTGWQWFGIVGVSILGAVVLGFVLYAMVVSVGCGGTVLIWTVSIGLVVLLMLATGEWSP